MNTLIIYIAVSIVVLAVIAIVRFRINKNKKQKGLSKLAGLSILFIISGMSFGDNRIIGYSLIGLGVLLAVIDIVGKLKKK